LPFIYGHSALIFENCSFVTTFFRNFATSLHKSEDYEEDFSGLCGLCCTLCL
jgi:hypothetical protein